MVLSPCEHIRLILFVFLPFFFCSELFKKLNDKHLQLYYALPTPFHISIFQSPSTLR